MANKVAAKRDRDALEDVDRKTAAEILLAYSREEWEQRRQSENQRSLMTNFVLTISSATILLIINKGLSMDTLPFAIFLIPLGVFGAIAVAKLSERGQYHIESAKAWREKVNELYPEAELLKLKEKARAVHDKKYGKVIINRFRLYALWMYFNLSIAIIGAVLVIFILYD
jgi:hypothetical protein